MGSAEVVAIIAAIVTGLVTVITTVLSLRSTERKHLSDDERGLRESLQQLLDDCERRCAECSAALLKALGK